MTTAETPIDVSQRSQLNEQVVREIRVWMVRRDLTQATIGEKIGENQMWVSRRLGKRRNTDLTLGEIQRFADALGLDVDRLLLPVTTGGKSGDSTRGNSTSLAA